MSASRDKFWEMILASEKKHIEATMKIQDWMLKRLEERARGRKS